MSSTSAVKSSRMSAGLVAELQQEAIASRKCLERIPEDKFDYKPHEKSMTMIRLAVHVAEMINWATVTCNSVELDFSTMDNTPFEPKTTAELVEYLDKQVAEAVAALQTTSDEAMMEPWTLRNGETVYFTMPRIQVLRGMVFNHAIHHRGQLSVYLRLNDIPVPSLYGPSADEGQM